MPITLFNPPCPHADPVRGGLAQNGTRCGNCICVPRHWRLHCTGGTTGYSRTFAGDHVLTRMLKDFLTGKDDQDCRWIKYIDLSALGSNTAGSWQLYYGSVDSGLGTLVFTGWIAVAVGFASTPAGIDTGVYGLASSLWWNCLGPNTLYHLDEDDGGGGLSDLGDTITVEPFWP